ncbi:MAG: hypothetical protein IIW44_07430 [Alistipes sp.]|nr:hypothetical protein [Alistipes sp.]
MNNKTLCLMKNIKMILLAATVALAASGCSSTFYTASSNAYDDLYAIHDRQAIAERQKAEAEARRAEAEARRAEAEAQQAEWRAQLAELGVELAQNNTRTDSDGVIIVDGDSYSSGNVYDSFLADSYESAYARRLRGFKSLTYNMPSSYFDLRYGNSRFYVSAYDPSFYNVMVSGSQVWVEPKYITSMFGTWGATNATMLIHSPWYYGWSTGLYDPFYYSSWGFPHYSWYDWNWNICYGGWGTNLWWGWGGVYRPWRPYYGFHYGPHHHHIGGLHMPPRWDMSGGGGYWYRGGNYYGSRGQSGSRVNGASPARGSSIVNRGSAHSTPYRSPNSGNTYGQGTRGQQGAAVNPSQNNAGRSQGSIGRNNSTRRPTTTVTPQRQNNSYNYNQNQNSNRQNYNQNQNFGSSTNRSSSFSSGSMGGGSRGGGAMGGGGGSRSSGSRGR